jgi:acetyltransferase
MDPEQVRQALRDVLAAIAPESAAQSLQPDRPLREQIDLDSMDWVNLLAALQLRLQAAVPEAELDRLRTLDDIVGCFAAQPSRPPDISAATAPRQYRVDGTEITLRPIAAADAPLEAEFVRQLSAESRYKRFMRTLGELPEEKLRYFTQVDGVQHVALVATVEREGRETLIGVARYIVDDAGEGCEFAVAVGDAWQGSGVAGLLMNALIAAARSRGLRRMEGSVLAANHRMLKFARQLGFTLQHDPEDRQTVRAALTL